MGVVLLIDPEALQKIFIYGIIENTHMFNTELKVDLKSI